MNIAIYFIAGITAYLIAGVNPAILFARLIYKKDIREEGSKNPGFTNFKRVFGMKWAWLVFILDFSKAFLLEWLFGWLFAKILGPEYRLLGIAITGACATIGHAYPVWYKFKGGKAYLVVLSTLWMLNWLVGLGCTLFMILLVLTVKIMSLSTLLSILAGAIILPFVGTPLIPSVIYAVCVLFVFYRHKANIVRLFKGEESKTYFFKKKSKAPESSGNK